MSEIWKQWEGQVVDHKYQLREYLGSTDHSVVFYAEYRDPEPRKAAVKFVPGNLPHAEELFADWKRAAQLNHPNLLRIYATGRYKMEDTEVLYAAMEYGEENLGQILPQRSLTMDETREMLGAVAKALGFLHDQNLTHGHIKPSNIFAIGDQLKVSSDAIQPVSEQREMRRQRDAYDAPEVPSAPYTPAADIWSLGVTVVEALTQQHAALPFKEDADPVIPSTVREPFLEIVRGALRRDPKSRWSSAQIAERLNPGAASAKAAAATVTASAPASPASGPVAQAPADASPAAPPSAPSASAVSPLSVPLSKEPAVPLAKQSSPPAAAARPPMPLPPIPSPAARPASRHPIVLPNYAVPLLAVVLVVIGAIALPKILHRRTEPEASTAPAAAPSATTNAPAVQPGSSARRAEPAPKQPAHVNAAPNNSGKPAAQETAQTLPAVPAPAPATLRRTETASSAAAKAASASPGRGEVLDQVLPRPSSSALATVQGTVRVMVKVHVDAAGNVSEALLDSPGPSKYFADQSVQAARGWVFNSPEVEGRSVPSEWSIRFEFTSSGVRAYPRQTKP